MRSRLRQRAIVSLLKTNDSPPKILASQLFLLFDVAPHIETITDNMTLQNVVVAVGNVLQSRQRLQEDVHTWAKELFRAAGLPFNLAPDGMDLGKTIVPAPSLSVVPSKPSIPKTETQSSPKRKTRRIYLDLAIQYLEKGSCTHKELVDVIMKQFPNLNHETVSTFAFDILNPKYSPIKDRPVVKLPDGRLIFEDKIKPALTVIENPNFTEVEKNEAEPVLPVKQAGLSGGDL